LFSKRGDRATVATALLLLLLPDTMVPSDCRQVAHGVYKHRHPTVHGLWPETGSYGNSRCVEPKDHSGPEHIKKSDYASSVGCFPDKHLAKHEWRAHGKCAGTKDALDYFQQICQLSDNPLRVMNEAAEAKGVEHRKRELEGLAKELSEAGMHVWYIDNWHKQIYLSVCSAKDGSWQLAPVGPKGNPEFDFTCH